MRPFVLVSAVVLALAGCTTPTLAPAGAPVAEAVLRGRLFDPRSGSVTDRAVVIIGEGRVQCAGSAAQCPPPDGVALHDYGDDMILPGLVDLHVHARPHFIGAFVPAGVTTVRDANNTLENLARMRAAEGSPRIVAAGPLLDGPQSVVLSMSPTGGKLGQHPIDTIMPIVVDDAASASAAVDALADAGVAWIKLYDQLSKTAFDAAVKAAHARGLPVMTDIGLAFTRGLRDEGIDIVQAAKAGVDTNEHLSGLALAYRRAGGDLESATVDGGKLDGIVASIRDSGMSVVPTAANSFQFADARHLSPDDLPGAAEMVPTFKDYWTYLADSDDATRAKADIDRRLLLAILPRLVAAGVRIGAGSDVPAAPFVLPGSALHQELEALVEAGLTPAQALAAATSTAADILRDPHIGRLQPGARADVLVIDGDALTDIRATRRVRAVWFDGHAVDLAASWKRVGSILEAAAAEHAKSGGH